MPGWLIGIWAASALAAWIGVSQLGLSSWPMTPWQAAQMLLLAPWLEEYVFRAGIQSWVSRRLQTRMGRLRGIGQAELLLLSLMFALAHVLDQPSGLWLLWLIPGYALAYVWRRAGSLRLNMATHFWFNASLLGCSLLLR